MRSFLCAAAVFLAALTTGIADQAPAATPAAGQDSPRKDLAVLVQVVRGKVQDGHTSKADLQGALDEFEALLAKYHDRKTDDVAQILYMEATLYAHVLHDNPKAKELLLRLKRDFPDTAQAKRVDEILASLDAPADAPPTGVAADLQALVERVQAKLGSGQSSAAALKDDLAAFDALKVKYRGQKAPEVAQIWAMKAELYAQVLHDYTSARAEVAELKQAVPDSDIANTLLTEFDHAEKAEKAQTAIIGKPAPALHFIWSSQQGLTGLDGFRGKVVVLDFWATWCGPCVASFPHVRELVDHYRGAPVVVIGVTSIQGEVANLQPEPIDTKGQPQKEESLLPEFMKAQNMNWTVAVSQEPVFNQDYGIEGIPYMVIIAPDGTVRYAGLHPAIPLEEKTKKIDAILAEFKTAAARP